MAFEEQGPGWKAEGTEPPESKKVEGWQPGDKPAADHFNWLLTRSTAAIEELQEKAAEQTSVDVLNAQVVASPDKTPVSLVSGQQVITSPRVAPYNVKSIKGLTRTNLLGRSSFESTPTGFSQFQATTELDTANFTTGKQGLKITISSGVYGAAYKGVIFKAGKYYVLVSDARNMTATTGVRPVIGAAGAAQIVNPPWLASQLSGFTTQWARINVGAADIAGGTVELQVNGAVGQIGVFDSARLYEITAAEYAALASMTPEQVAAKYPYVDDVKPINTPYVIKYGDNLFPTFYELYQPALNGMVPNINGPYSADFTTSATNQYVGFLSVPFIPGQQYTVSAAAVTGAVQVYVNQLDNTGALTQIKGTLPLTFTPGANIVQVGVYFGGDTTGSFSVSKPMLNLGDTALPFKPREDDYLIFPEKLHSNIDRSVYDEITYRDGQYWKNSRFKELELDGSLGWTFNTDGSGFKTVYCIFSGGILDSATVVKYDGKPLTRIPYAVPGAADQQAYNGNSLVIAIADTDSGWGESYTPTQAEIQAYFNGWLMSGSSTDSNLKYDGSAGQTKTWWARGLSGVWTQTLPTGRASTVYTPYKLIYQLAAPTTEVIPVEGGITLHEGLNQLEVGAGMVVREKANPVRGGAGDDFYYINNPSTGFEASLLKNRTVRYFGVYKDNVRDNWLYGAAIVSSGYTQKKAASQYDQSATYTVTYLPLDLYLLTGPVQAIDGEYSANLKTTVDTLARSQADALTRVSVLESQKAGKEQPQWIMPTLLNGWVNYDGGYEQSGYLKDSFGFVHIRGFIKSGNGASGTSLFTLPKGYRPLTSCGFPALSSNNSALAPIIIEIRNDGRVLIGATGSASNSWLEINSVFLAEA